MILLSNEKKDEYASVKAGLVMIKKELEEKTGRTGSSSSSKATNQDEFLKRLNNKKKINEETEIDISNLNRSYKFTEDVDVNKILEYTKDKQWSDNKNIQLINVTMIAYGLTGDYKRAEIEYKKAINIDPKNEDIMYNIGEIYLKQGELQQALEKLMPLVKTGNDHDAIYLTAFILYLQGKKEQAGGLIATALKTDTEIERVHINFAFLSLIRENYAKAEEILTELINNVPSNIIGRIVLMYIEVHRGNHDKYKADLEVVKQLIRDPKSIYMKYIELSKLYYLERKKICNEVEKYNENLEINNLFSFYERNRYNLICKKDAIIYDNFKEIVLKNISFKPLLILLFKASYILKKGEDFNKVLSLLVKTMPEQTISLFVRGEIVPVKIKEFVKKISTYKNYDINVEIDGEIEPFNDFCIYLLHIKYNTYNIKL